MSERNPSIDFNVIRTHDGSQNRGFEELVCQLARLQKYDNAEFTRLGTPDSGVEAYWTFENGVEYGWQAKYFTTLGYTQWRQIKGSYINAKKTHPRLKRYYVCVPLDRPDGRIHNQKTAMDRWNEWATKVLEEEGVELIYWGNSELVDLLTKPENGGLRFYWFNSQVLDFAWFSKHISDVIKDIGPRYFPECNVPLKIAKWFAILRKNQEALQKHHEICNTFIGVIDKVADVATDLGITSAFKIEEISETLKLACFTPNKIDWKVVEKGGDEICAWINEHLNETISKKAEENSDQVAKVNQCLRDFYAGLSEFQYKIDSKYVALFNNEGMVLRGEAGSGKSHLLAHVAESCIQEGRPCILLLGQRFINNHPLWQQISEQLGVTCEEETFFQVLNVLGELKNERILFMIDALNEGYGIGFWGNYLAGFINKIKRHPYISLVISIRSTYFEKFKEIINGELCLIEHQGFSNGELPIALETYFKHFGLNGINIPLLNPEFKNPLFLKLFCRGISNDAQRRIPKGINGLSRIFSWVLEDTDKAIERRHEQNASSLRLTNELVITITKKMVEQKRSYLFYREAAQLIGNVTKGYTLSLRNNLLEDLIQEGIFTRDMRYISDVNSQEIVRFTYERMEHFFKAQVLLDTISKNDLLEKFTKDEELIGEIQDDDGMAEMLSIIIPEKFNYELYTLLKEEHITWGIRRAYLQSLLWREGENINVEELNRFVAKYLIDDDFLRRTFIDILFVLATIEDFPLNAEWLHLWLSQYSMAIRDSLWTTEISWNQGVSEDSISRLIDWCSRNTNMEWSNKLRLLVATSLTWIFTTTNNALRNKVTFILVRVLINHLDVVPQLLQQFAQVDDSYVHERLFAAVYGAALNSEITSDITDIAQWIVDNVFNKDEVFPNILVRDYARNIVEYALFKNVFVLEDCELIRPPYKSTFPDTLPSNDDINLLASNYPSEETWNMNEEIIASMATEYGRGVGCYGDFGRYVFQAKLKNWKEFNVQELSNYATLLIFDKYGYSSKLHGYFDKCNRSIGRDTKTTERIGKKYQWIAMREVIARVSDKYKIMLERNWEEETRKQYNPGPWELLCRDIDPTYLWGNLPIENVKCEYSIREKDSSKWSKTFDDMPNFLNCIEYTDMNDDTWISLRGILKWERPSMNLTSKQQTTISLYAAFLKDRCVDQLSTEMKINKDKIHFPLSNYQTQICLHEYFWSPAYKSRCDDSFNNSGLWDDVYDENGILWPSKIAISDYFWESDIDGKSTSHIVPSEELATFFQLSPGRCAGEWVSNTKEVICREIFANDTNSKVFLIKKEKLLEFLDYKKYLISWSVCSEKVVVNYRSLPFRGRLEGYILNEGKLQKLYEKNI